MTTRLWTTNIDASLSFERNDDKVTNTCEVALRQTGRPTETTKATSVRAWGGEETETLWCYCETEPPVSKVRACVCGVPSTKDSVVVPKHLAQLPATSPPLIPSLFSALVPCLCGLLNVVATAESFGSKQLFIQAMKTKYPLVRFE